MSSQIESQSDDKAPQYAQLGGVIPPQNNDQNNGNNNVSNASNNISNDNNEYITFDFMINLSLSDLEILKLKTAIKESADCNLDQIKELKVNEINDGSSKKTSRVNGKIYTDDWELPMLQKKFKKIISDRVLSGQLQDICSLEDRPMIRRFFCKTSKEVNNLSQLTTTDSLRTLKDDHVKGIAITATPKLKDASAKNNISASDDGVSNTNTTTTTNNNSNHNKDKMDDQCECFCIIL